MRILHFDLARIFRGGQRQALLLHKNLLKQHTDSFLVTDSKGLLYQYCKELEVKNVYGLELPTLKPEFFSRLLAYPKIKNLVKKIRPDILHFHEPASMLYGIHLNHFLTFETRRVSFPIKPSSISLKYSKIHVHTAVSQSICDYLRSCGLERVHLIRSSIDLSRFQKVQGPEVLQDKKKVNLLYAGSFTEMKGIDILFEALPMVLRKESNLMLHMVGDGVLLQGFRNLSEERSLHDHIRFYPRTDEPAPYLFESDIVIVPSVWGEGSNGVIKEAMACGKIVIASDLVNNAELIEHGKDGLLFKNKNSRDLADKVLEVIDGKYTISADSLKKKALGFSAEKMTGEYLQLYRDYLQSFKYPKS
ncbi:glycosyltransferase family 4 protein [Robertkochia aurantiaca]|uniref:glycosyltransferase family 4 protein n=1 Tax=Robertkochia aurantiaca TaxID=2873700 RepID=UPI001CCBD9F4|nr:glycosyltransferase family 4 protein [Robertkochia sp. 3YJGBD-33]